MSPTSSFPPNKKPAPPRPPIPKTKWKTDTTPTKAATAPIDLNLADDEQGHRRGLGRGSSSSDSPEVLGALAGKRSPAENVELLYEYFPLSLDDW